MYGGREAVRGDVSDVIAVQVEPQQSFEGAKEVCREARELVLTKEKRCEGVSKVEVITISQIDDLIPESSED